MKQFGKHKERNEERIRPKLDYRRSRNEGSSLNDNRLTRFMEKIHQQRCKERMETHYRFSCTAVYRDKDASPKRNGYLG